MNYKIKFDVFDNTNKSVHQEIISKELVNPTVSDVKTLLNPGTYTNIKSELFVGNNKNNLNEGDVINSSFIVYTINLN